MIAALATKPVARDAGHTAALWAKHVHGHASANEAVVPVGLVVGSVFRGVLKISITSYWESSIHSFFCVLRKLAVRSDGGRQV